MELVGMDIRVMDTRVDDGLDQSNKMIIPLST